MNKLVKILNYFFKKTPKEQMNISKGIIADNKETFNGDYKLIDLGLPSGTLWMDRNIGASSPTDFGLYSTWEKANCHIAIDADYQFTDGKCQMPTKEQLQELIDNTTYEWATQDGVNGGLFTSKINGNSIFVPAAGIYGAGSVDADGECGFLWSDSAYRYDTGSAWYLGFDCEEVGYSHNKGCGGLSIRCVVSNSK